MTPPPDETDPQPQPPAEPAPTEPARPEVRKPSSETDRSKAGKGTKEKPEPETALGKFWVWIKPILKVVLVVWLVRTAIIDWNDVPSGSMEPTIQVGDRILVNKMAYAGQLPLSGPKIGIPFTQYQWDNPLDFLPQLQWGKPARGDIVTFWNPVSGVRMVKRIVAEPGDTIEMRGGVLTINGQAASYKDVTPSTVPSTRLQIDGNAGQANLGSSYRIVPLTFLEETILGETRMIQHMLAQEPPQVRRWTEYLGIVLLDSGNTLDYTADGQIVVPDDGRQVSPERWAQTQDDPIKHFFEIRDGLAYLDGKPVSYNDFTAAWLSPFEGVKIDLPNGDRVEIKGGALVLNGEPAFITQFSDSLKQIESKPKSKLTPQEVYLSLRLGLLHQLLYTSFGPVTMGDDEYFMVGDNRQNSSDSRYFGPVKRGEITGEAVAIAASFEGRILKLPPEPRWSRWFKGLGYSPE